MHFKLKSHSDLHRIYSILYTLSYYHLKSSDKSDARSQASMVAFWSRKPTPDALALLIMTTFKNLALRNDGHFHVLLLDNRPVTPNYTSHWGVTPVRVISEIPSSILKKCPSAKERWQRRQFLISEPKVGNTVKKKMANKLPPSHLYRAWLIRDSWHQ